MKFLELKNYAIAILTDSRALLEHSRRLIHNWLNLVSSNQIIIASRYSKAIFRGAAVILVSIPVIVNAAELDRPIDFPNLEQIEEEYIKQTGNIQDVINNTSNLFDDVQQLSGIEDEEEHIRASLETGFEFERHIISLKESRRDIAELMETTQMEYLENATDVENGVIFNNAAREEQLALLDLQIQQSVERIQQHDSDLSTESRRWLRDANQRFQEKRAFIANQPDWLRTFRTERDVRSLLDSLANNLAWVDHHLFITTGLSQMLEAARMTRSIQLVNEVNVKSSVFPNLEVMKSTFDGIDSLSGENPDEVINDSSLFENTYQ
jgi:hypothetical protein